MAARENIYYWKCDRPSAFFAIKGENGSALIEEGISKALTDYFGDGDFVLSPAGGQGNHLTYTATRGGIDLFVRIENGPEGDEYMEVESAVMDRVRAVGVPTPRIWAVDAWRERYPFAWQLMERVPCSDLNQLYKAGLLDTQSVFRGLGELIARWQRITAPGYGPFSSTVLRGEGRLAGLLPSYRDYYTLNLERHLGFLVSKGFLDGGRAREIDGLISASSDYLDISRGCLVHKDIALWNVLGDKDTIRSVIDWDDSISGDPTDDLSLMGCFHSGDEMRALIAGYIEASPLPDDFESRFWLHMLRNMIFKAVIRVGAGYFDKGNNFFLINSPEGGQSLRRETLDRIAAACEGLRGDKNIFEL
jgi:fructosamine-3-kinase